MPASLPALPPMRPGLLAATLLLGVLGGLATTARAAAPFNCTWEASSGLRPENACPQWSAAYYSPDSLPAFVAGAMRVRTNQCSESISYTQHDTLLTLPDTLIVEARLRFRSGNQCAACTPGLTHYRQGASFAITTAPNTGTIVFVGPDHVFMSTSHCGSQVITGIDTDDLAHTYRIEIAAGTVRVYYDGGLILTASTYVDAPDHSSRVRISWGEGSFLARGTVDWIYVKHNAHRDGCSPAAVPVAVTPPLPLHATPNPFQAATMLRYELPRAGAVRLDIVTVTGRRVRTLVDGWLSAGQHDADWDGTDDAGRTLPAGVYYAALKGPGSGAARALLRLR